MAPAVGALGVGVIALVWMYLDTARLLSTRWSVDPNYSHAWLVPVFSVLLALRIRRTVASRGWAVSSLEIANGMACLLAGVVTHTFAWVLGYLLMDVISLILLLRGALWIHGGHRSVRAYSGPILFLILMAPLPFSWQQQIAVSLQEVVSVLSWGILRVIGVPVAREGYLLHLPGVTLEVAEACSGLRQVMVFVAAAGAYLVCYSRPLWARAVLLGSSIVVAVSANTFRIVLTGILVAFGAKSWAEGVFHTLEGVGTAALGASALVFIGQMLPRSESR